jgi:hypothetical protein
VDSSAGAFSERDVHVNASRASRTLLLASVEERELVEFDGLVAGSAAAGPAAQEGLEEQHRLRQCGPAAGWRHRRSRVREACAQVTSAVWWWKPAPLRPS